MKLNLLVLLIFSVMVSIKVSAQNEEAGPQVVQAYSAIYPSVAAAARASGSVVVEAEIDSSGKVTSVRTVEGIRLLGAAAEKSARRWIFNPEDIKTRTVRLTFTFKLVQDDAPADELLPIFLPPYQIEVRRALPKVVDSPNVDPPLPLKKKP
ncbi:MAG: TonB family protein [Ignavibacteria bacterium]|nr:TonB family protein [Acidobacteriota bacterium]MBK7034611.1 TonB family protein [Ignavibacteria bacterium]MBK7804180.1 TonB family protein [Chloracidobacterium sp.]